MLLGLRGDRGTAKLHWNEMDEHQKRTAAQRLADVEGLHLVAIGAPLPIRRQERARAACLRLPVHELHAYGVGELLIESRTTELDRRDVATVRGARYELPKGTQFRVEHQIGAKEPLFRAADIIAGAVRSQLTGDSTYQDILADRLYDVTVMTDCRPGQSGSLRTCVRPGSRSAPGAPGLATRLSTRGAKLRRGCYSAVRDLVSRRIPAHQTVFPGQSMPKTCAGVRRPIGRRPGGLTRRRPPGRAWRRSGPGPGTTSPASPGPRRRA